MAYSSQHRCMKSIIRDIVIALCILTPQYGSAASEQVPVNGVAVAETSKLPLLQYLGGTYIPWSKITPELIRAQLPLVKADIQIRVDSIAAVPPDEATWENTFQAYDEVWTDLIGVYTCIHFLHYMQGTPEWKTLTEEILPEYTAWNTQIHQHAGLWNVLKTAAASEWMKRQSPVRRNAAEKLCSFFVLDGAELPQPQQEAVCRIRKEINALRIKYEQNVKESSDKCELHITENYQELADLPTVLLMKGRQVAMEEGRPGFLFTLRHHLLKELMYHSESESIRRRAWEAESKVGNMPGMDNTEIMLQIGALRSELAELHGFDNHADMNAHYRMMGTGRAALNFTDEIMQRLLPIMKEMHATLLQIYNERTGKNVTAVPIWDAIYAYSYLPDEYRNGELIGRCEYFDVETILQGALRIYRDLCGIDFRERKTSAGDSLDTVDVWHADVRCWDVYDVETNEFLGVLYADLYQRDDKRTGDVILTLQVPRRNDETGERQPCINVLSLNLDKDERYMTVEEVRSLFHEIGHAVHGMLGCGALSIQGVSFVESDFMELPSTLSSYLLMDPQIFKTIARHPETNDEFPDSMLSAISPCTFFSLENLMFQLRVAKVDLEFNLYYKEKFVGKNLDEVTHAICSPWELPQEGMPPSFLRRVPHLLNGNYIGGYYSYIWAEVMAADIYKKIKNEGVTNPSVWKEYRRNILEKGATEPAIQLYRNYMGREPDLDAFIR